MSDKDQIAAEAAAREALNRVVQLGFVFKEPRVYEMAVKEIQSAIEKRDQQWIAAIRSKGRWPTDVRAAQASEQVAGIIIPKHPPKGTGRGEWTVERVYAVWDSMRYDDDFKPSKRFVENLVAEINAITTEPAHASEQGEDALAQIASTLDDDDTYSDSELGVSVIRTEALRQLRAAHANEIDPVTGYRYDQEIPKPICEMEQLKPAHASEIDRFVIRDHALFDTRENAFVGIGDVCYLLNESLAAHASEPRKAEQLLGDLLAVIHGDGGHYESEHGSDKATKDALEKYHKLLTRLDAAEYALSQRPTEHASEKGADLFWDDKYVDEQLGREASWPQIIEAANHSIQSAIEKQSDDTKPILTNAEAKIIWEGAKSERGRCITCDSIATILDAAMSPTRRKEAQ